MPSWLHNLLTWFIDHWNQLVTYFKDNEQWLSGMGNFITIVLGLVTIAGFIFGWWKRAWKYLKGLRGERRSAKLDPSFPFDLIETRDDLLAHLYPRIAGASIPDHEIPYFQRPSHIAVQHEFRGHRKVILGGKSKTGKTRIAAEIVAEFIMRGWTVLLLKPFALVDTPMQLPEFLARRQVILFVDNIERYLVDLSNSSENQLRLDSFEERLTRFVTYLEKALGHNSVRLIGTVRLDAVSWLDTGHSEDERRWNSIPIVGLENVTQNDASHLIHRLIKMSGTTVSQELQKELAEKITGNFSRSSWHLDSGRPRG